MVDCYYQDRKQEKGEAQEEEEYADPYTIFVYTIRSPYTKESYFRRLRRFFDSIDLFKGQTMEKRCNAFAYRGRNDGKWAFSNILKFLYYQKERVEEKDITASRHNCDDR
ncbi:MAG TPA: hypothetical protein VE089_00675 [Nitrososphaeraceae archaeon]|nr:hypothetical protein [Nitrososphaeraceae archaeon]